MQSDSAPLERARIALPDLVADVLALYRAEAEGRGITLATDLPPLPSPRSTATRMLLREALTNLVDNALVHGGPGLGRIEIAARPTASGLRIEVRG